MPSTATGVATQGTPAARLDTTLPFTPAPYRSGATVSRRDSNQGAASATGPT
jgi:hypothetical protein